MYNLTLLACWFIYTGIIPRFGLIATGLAVLIAGQQAVDSVCCAPSDAPSLGTPFVVMLRSILALIMAYSGGPGGGGTGFS